MLPEKFSEKLILARSLRRQPQLFKQFAHDSHTENRRNIAHLRDAPAPVLKDMAFDPDTRVKRILAHNPTTPVTALKVLAKDPDLHVRFGVITNKNSTSDVLASVEFRDRLKLAQSLAKNAQTPKQVLLELGHHEEPIVRQAVALNRNAGGDTRHILKSDPSPWVRKSLRKGACTFWGDQDPSNQIEIFKQGSEREKNEWARYGKNPDLLKYISQYDDPQIRGALASNKNLPNSILELLKMDSAQSVRNIATGNHVKWLAKYKKERDDWHTARRSTTSSDALRRLAEHDKYTIRYHVAKHPNTPEDALSILFHNSDKMDYYNQVQRNLLSREDLPQDILKKFLEHENVSMRAQALRQKNIPKDILRNFYDLSAAPEILMSVACHPNVDVEFLKSLVKHENLNVRRTVAVSPNVTGGILETLADGENTGIWGAIARNPKTPQAVLDRISSSQDRWVKKAVAQYSSNPVILYKLSNETDRYILSEIVKNWNTSYKTLQKLAAHRKESVRMSFFEVDQPQEYKVSRFN